MVTGGQVFKPDADPRNADWTKVAAKTRKSANDLGMSHLEKARDEALAGDFVSAADHCRCARNAFTIAAQY